MKLLKLILCLAFFPTIALANCEIIEFDANSNIIRAKIISTATNQGLTGLSSASSGLIISTIASSEATPTVYTVAASNVETITTLGTYAAPTSAKARFREVDATNHPGIYEFQIADARFSVSGSKTLLLSASGATNMQQMDCSIPLVYTLTDVANAVVNSVPTAPSACITPGTSNVGQILSYVGAAIKNKVSCTSSSCILYAADGTTPVCTFGNSDNGTTFTSAAGS